MVALQPLADEALSERALKSLKEAITTLQLPPGQPLVERQLAEWLGVSTTPIRHAIRQLANEGLVEIVANRSAIVRRLTPTDIEEIFALREVLEPIALRSAMSRLGSRLERALERSLNDSADAIEAKDFAALAVHNRRFNDAFVAGCGNQRLRTILETLHAQTQQIGAVAWRYRRSASLDHEQHLRILAAVRRGDYDEADAAVREHVRSACHEFLLAYPLYEQAQQTTSVAARRRSADASRPS
jgi:DNA-binding GntR family transcriptional regulator